MVLLAGSQLQPKGLLLARLGHFLAFERECFSILGARTLLGAPGHTTSNKKLLGTKGIATRSKDATKHITTSFICRLVLASAAFGDRLKRWYPNYICKQNTAAP